MIVRIIKVIVHKRTESDQCIVGTESTSFSFSFFSVLCLTLIGNNLSRYCIQGPNWHWVHFNLCQQNQDKVWGRGNKFSTNTTAKQKPKRMFGGKSDRTMDYQLQLWKLKNERGRSTSFQGLSSLFSAF